MSIRARGYAARQRAARERPRSNRERDVLRIRKQSKTAQVMKRVCVGNERVFEDGSRHRTRCARMRGVRRTVTVAGSANR